MKRIIIAIMLLTTLLSSCAPATAEATATSTPVPTFTLTPTITLTPTLTPIPTITPTPPLPDTIKITIDDKIPENIASLVTTTVDQAYWFYKNLGCSPEFDHVSVLPHDIAEGEAGGINVGWDDLTTISPNMDVRISHEMAHAMCELNFTKDPTTGTELMWLFEGVANYFTSFERFTDTGMQSGSSGNIYDHEIAMGEWVIQTNLCDFPFEKVEQDSTILGKDFPNYPGVGEVAATLLAATSPDGTDALINYYVLLANQPSDIAFQQAFGRAKPEFYAEFRSQCSQGFPALKKNVPTPTLAAGFGSVQGNVILKDDIQKYGDYILVFCNIKVEMCGQGTPIRVDGTFSAAIEPGRYRISINSVIADLNPGWYTPKGLVIDPSCAEVVTVMAGQTISLTIDLHYVSCRK